MRLYTTKELGKLEYGTRFAIYSCLNGRICFFIKRASGIYWDEPPNKPSVPDPVLDPSVYGEYDGHKANISDDSEVFIDQVV